MVITGIFVLLYGVLVILGGVIGFLKANSLVSLLMGVSFGIVVAVSGYFILQGKTRALYWAFGFSLILLAVFLLRYWQTHAMMPSGMMAILSFIVCVMLFLQKLQLK